MMKKTKFYILPFVVCAIILTQSNISAQTAESEAAVEIIPGTGPTYPVNPEDPETPIGGGGVDGSLAIVSVSHFDFGQIPVTSGPTSVDIKTEKPNIQVVDLRGTAVGWKVSASVSRFKDNGSDTLPGAVIRIMTGTPNSLSSSLEPVQISNTLLTTDGATIPVLKAEAGAGTGHWIMRWYPSDEEATYIKLEIPAGMAITGNHKATINWILGNTP